MSESTDQQPIEAGRSPRPRIRTGAVIWGLMLIAGSLLALWMATRPDGRDDFIDALLGLDGFGWTIVTVLAVGGTITHVALAAVIRRVQHRMAQPKP